MSRTDDSTGGVADNAADSAADNDQAAQPAGRDAATPAASEASAKTSGQRGTRPSAADAKNALLALNRREPEAPRRSPQPQADALEALDTERILEMPRRRDEPAQAPVTPLPITRVGQARTPRAMTSLGEVTASYVARLPRRPAPAAMASDEHQPAPTRRKAAPPQLDVCPLCHGAGYLRLDVPVGHPDFGRAVQCECKEREIEERKRSKLRGMSGLRPFETMTFNAFDPAIPGVQEAHEAALRYAGDPTGWLVFQGGFGCGKTHLAAAIAHEREREGDSVFFAVVPDLLDHLRAAFAPTSDMTYDELFDRIRVTDMLVLDDLGSENGTAWATEKLFQLINYRYNFRIPTIITTNTRLMSHMDERIRSRLNDRGLVRPIQMEAQDYRVRHAGRPSRGGGAGTRGRGYTR